MESSDFKNWCVGVFYIFGVLTIIGVLVIPGKVGDDLNEALDEMAKITSCEIHYNDFYFKGLCSDKGEILDFLNNQTIRGCYNAGNNNKSTN